MHRTIPHLGIKLWLGAALSGLMLLGSCSSSITSPDVSLTSIAPQVVCGAQLTTRVVASGDGFAPLTINSLVTGTALQLPHVVLNQSQRADGSPGSRTDIIVFDQTDPSGANHVTWQSAQQMSFDIYPGMVVSDATTGAPGQNLDYGLYDVAIRNPDQRQATLAGGLAVVQPPNVTQVTPNPSCDAQNTASYTITGDHFLQINSDLPTVTFQSTTGQGMPLTVTASSLGGCMPLPSPNGLTLMSCTTLTASIMQNALAPDDYRIVVTNPDQANCTSQEDATNPAADRMVVIPPPTITSATSLAVCAIAATPLKITGTNFLQLSNPAATPSLSINGMMFPSVVDPTSCVPVNMQDAPGAQLCTVLTVNIPSGALAVGSYQATLQNPGGDACAVSGAIQINVVAGPPTLDNATAIPPNPNPRTLCSGGGQMILTGENIYSGAIVTIGGFAAGSVNVAPTGMTVNGLPQQQVTSQFGGPIPVTSIGMLDDVTVQNVPGVAACDATLPAVETITNGPSIVYVDPPTIPGVINIQATVYATGVAPPIKQIQIFPAGGNVAVQTFTTNSNPPLVLDAAFANRAYITIKAGSLPAGKYDMVLTDQNVTCPARLPNAINVVANPTLTVTSATPPFGSTAQNTATVIAGSGFVSVPRAYLSPAGATGNAQAMSAVTYSSPTSLSGVVRSGLAAGSYDLVVVNPNGAFGLAKNAFVVTTAAAPPPVISSIAPSSVVQGTATPVVFNGSGFRSGATASLSCFDANNAAVAGATASVTAVAGMGNTANVTITAPSGALYCTARLTNQDGTYFDYAAIGVTNAGLNLSGFKPGNNLLSARRALAAVAGRPTAVARYVYAIGGDNGADNAPKSSIEVAPTSLSGTLGAFTALPTALPKALSFLGATVIGRFIYTVGGFDGTAASKAVYRAEILSPLNAPQFSDVNYNYSATTGLAGAVYVYRISAVLNNTDANNPGGETLAGDFFPIQVPTLGAGYLQVQLFWPAVTNAASYKIFRTVLNGAAGTEKLIATVNNVAGNMTQTYTDTGAAMPAGATPLPLGSTGSWTAALPALTTARSGAAVTAMQDPGNANLYYLYAAGGNSGTLAAPTPLQSVEFLPITVTNTGTVQTQSFTTWTAATSTLSAARWLAAGLAATAANNSLIPANTGYLYVGGGSTSNVTNFSKGVDVAQVKAGGQLAAFTDSGEKNQPRPGYGGALVNNQMMAFGGFAAGAATTASDTAQLASATTLNNFNSLGGGVLGQPRALQGTALESAFIYQLGGANAGVNTAQNTTEQTIW